LNTGHCFLFMIDNNAW